MTILDAFINLIYISVFPITVAAMLGGFVAFLPKKLLRSIIRFIDHN